MKFNFYTRSNQRKFVTTINLAGKCIERPHRKTSQGEFVLKPSSLPPLPFLSCSTNLVAAVPADAFAVAAAAGDDGVLAAENAAAAAVGAEVDAADVAEAAIVVVAAGDYPIVHC